MAQKIKTVNIDLGNGKKKDFLVKELTVQNILDLSQSNAFFKSTDASDTKKSQNGGKPAKTEPEKGFFEEMTEYGKEISKIIEMSCDFELKDLKELAPSDIEELYTSFKEVNQTFLSVLAKLKILEMFMAVAQKHMNNFSKTLAIL